MQPVLLAVLNWCDASTGLVLRLAEHDWRVREPRIDLPRVERSNESTGVL